MLEVYKILIGFFFSVESYIERQRKLTESRIVTSTEHVHHTSLFPASQVWVRVNSQNKGF